jgi:hypothetical protein
MSKLKKGDLVIKNPRTWIKNDFDSWGRGQGIGEVVDDTYIEDKEVDVRWPGGKCYESINQLMKVTVTEKSILKRGEFLKNLLGFIATKQNGFFDWQYSGDPEHDKMIDYEFYFDHLPDECLNGISVMMQAHPQYMPVLRGGVHSNAKIGHQICLKFRLPLKDIL